MVAWTAVIKKYWFIGALALAAVLWLREHDAQLRYQTLAEVRLDSVKTINAQLDRSYYTMMQKDSVIAVQRRQLENSRIALRQRENTAAAETREKVKELRAQLSGAQQEELDSLVAGFEAQLTLVHQQLQATVELQLIAERQVTARDSMITELRVANARITQMLENEVNSNKKSLVDGAIKTLPWLVAGAAILLR